MRVAVSCVLPGPQPFGVANYILGLIRGLRSTAGPGRSLVVYERGVQANALAGPDADEALERRHAPASTRFPALRVAWEQLVLPQRCRRDGVDVLHAPSYIAPATASVPAVVTIHDVFTTTAPQYCTLRNRLHHAALLGRSLSRAKVVVTPSEAVRRELVSLFPSVTARARAVLPGVDPLFRATPSRASIRAVRRRWRLPRRFILWTGNLEPKKNVSGLLGAFRIARRRGVQAELVMAGGSGWGTLPPSALSRACEGVRWLGYVSPADLAVLYHESLLFAFPSFAEGVGLPVLEAMAAGKAVVCSAVPAALETDPRAVALVDPHRSESIAEAMCSLACDPDRRARLGAGAAAATKTLTWERHARQMWELYGQA